MNKTGFTQWIQENIVYLDGATGSNLLKRGMPGGVCPEKWILDHKEALYELQREYVEAGSNILYAPTFSGNRIKLKEYGYEEEIKKINTELVMLSKEAAGDKALVAGDITMTGRQLAPIGTLDFEELITIYKEQISYLAEAGADLLVVETMMSIQEARAALIAAKETCDLPVMVTMTFEADGRTLYGTDAVTAAITLESLGAAAVGANCSTGPDKMAGLIERMAEAVNIPVIAKPNAGLPVLSETGETVYDMGAETFGKEMALLAEKGAAILGGCCGTTPEHIKSLVWETKALAPQRKPQNENRYLTSERKTKAFGLSDNFIVIGERINPTGKKKLQEELKEGSFEMVKQFAQEQEERGAEILDVNMGMSGIDEKAMMLRAIEEVTQISSLPLAIDSSYVEVMEAALRRYPGRALINSVSGESSKLEKLLPIARKYGAMFILLPVSDAGLPKDLEEKKNIINHIYERAEAYGFAKKDIVVDGLVTTVGANKQAALETLETIRYCKEQGFATVCGLSNISFGLPERGYVNSAFITMAIQAGLTMAIANPSQQLLISSAFASDLLLNKKEADVRYIEWTAQADKNKEQADLEANRMSAAERVRYAVLKGNKAQIVRLTKEALTENDKAETLLNETLLPAINEVGELFEKGKYFLPQLIASAEAMKQSVEYLEPLLLDNKAGKEMPTIVIATVKGDIHDIGKNLVALMFKNHGFKVIDLGKDVAKEDIVEAARVHNAKIIALSALMTTTMQEMKQVIDYKKERQVAGYVMIGGAVITEDYAEEIGADGYSKDAADAVRVAKRLLKLE